MGVKGAQKSRRHSLVARVPVVDFQLHRTFVHDRVGRFHVGLQVQLEFVKRGEREPSNDVVVQLVHDALHNRLIYAIEGSFDFFL